MKSEFDPKILLQPEGFHNHWQFDLSDEEYHRKVNSVGSSNLRKIRKSPMSFYHQHFLGRRNAPTNAMRFGTIAHGVILSGRSYLDKFAVMPKFVGKTKDGRDSEQSSEAKQMKKDWLAKLPPSVQVITQEELEHLNGMVDALINHPKAFKLLEKGQPEIAGYWRDEETGIGCHCKPDFLSFNLNALVELKTATDCTEESFMRQVFDDKYRYDIQLAMYAEGIKNITGLSPEHRVWIVIEKEPPYELAIHEADQLVCEIGSYEFRHCLRKLKECIDKDRWPGYTTVIDTATPPPYVVHKYQALGAL